MANREANGNQSMATIPLVLGVTSLLLMGFGYLIIWGLFSCTTCTEGALIGGLYVLMLAVGAVGAGIGAIITGVAARRKPDQPKRDKALSMVGLVLASVTIVGVLAGILSLAIAVVAADIDDIDRRADQTLRRTRPGTPSELTILRDREAQRVLALGSDGSDTPQRIAELSKRGRTALLEGKWQTCAERYGDVLVFDRANFQASAGLAVCLYELDLVDAALGRALDALAKVPTPGLFFAAGSCYVKKGDKRRALAWLEAAVKGGFKNLRTIRRNYAPYLTDPAYVAIVASLR